LWQRCPVDGAARYLLLETLRHYGRQRLPANTMAAAVPRQHAMYFTALADALARVTD
jgi:predicted ATPase